MTSPFTLLSSLFGDPALDAHFDDRAHLQGLLDFEAALARAEAEAGIIPVTAAAMITAACRADFYDRPAIAAAAATAGNTAIPLVKALTARVAADDAEAARWVHWGATSQDAIDTGLVLQCRAALGQLESGWAKLEAALAALAGRHATTPEIGRTWLQHAVPISFGLKVATWLSQAMRAGDRLAAAGREAMALQFGGAAGTLAALGPEGLRVGALLAAQLNLVLPDLPWHGQRDRLGALAAALGLAIGALGKIARDVSLLSQSEIAEVAEPAGDGRGGSSTMPHKRNPVACAVALAAAERAPGLVATMLAAQTGEHERSLGPWQAEWETLPQLFHLLGGSLRQMVLAIEGLVVDPARMAVNIDVTRGLVFAEAVSMALAAKIGRALAHHVVEQASHRAVAEGRHLALILAAEPTVTAHLDTAGLHALFDPARYLGQSAAFTARVLASYHARRPTEGP